MREKNRFLIAIMISASVFLIFMVVTLFKQQKKMELSFNERKAELIKENLDLKDKGEDLSEIVGQKEEALALLNENREAIEQELEVFDGRMKAMQEQYEEQIQSLRNESASLAQRVDYLESMPLSGRIKEAMVNEENQKLKSFLAKVISNIEIIKKGGDIELEPIVVTNKKQTQHEMPQTEISWKVVSEKSPSEPVKAGKVISVDEKYSLVVFDLGRKEGVERGEQCAILKDGQKIATAEIISSRYRVAAAFVYELEYGYNIYDIREGDAITIID